MGKAPQHLEASLTYERIAASVANLDQKLRVALMLRSDSELRSSLAGKSASIAYAIPERRGWLMVGQDAVSLSRTQAHDTAARPLTELFNDSRVTAALRNSTSTSARQKSERLIREGLLQSDRTLFTQLEYWAPLLEAELYILSTAYTDLLNVQSRLTHDRATPNHRPTAYRKRRHRHRLHLPRRQPG